VAAQSSPRHCADLVALEDLPDGAAEDPPERIVTFAGSRRDGVDAKLSEHAVAIDQRPDGFGGACLGADARDRPYRARGMNPRAIKGHARLHDGKAHLLHQGIDDGPYEVGGTL